MRFIVRLLFAAAILLVVSPFVLSWLYIGQRGVPLRGEVFSKDEWVRVHDTSWNRQAEVVVQYHPLEEAGVTFHKQEVDLDRFDSLHKGDAVQLLYLRREDIPRLPGAATLRQMHLLPRVRLAGQAISSGFALILLIVPAVIVVLILWRMARISYWGWGLAFCVLCGMAIAAVHDFPTPVPAPAVNVRRTRGVVKSLDRIEWLYRDNKSQGFQMEQPVQVVGVQFVPEGRADSVLGIDLIDAGSIPDLQEHGTVGVEYESVTPRTARVIGGSREFVRRNLQGIAVEVVLCLLVLIVALVGVALFGRWYRNLTRRVS